MINNIELNTAIECLGYKDYYTIDKNGEYSLLDLKISHDENCIFVKKNNLVYTIKSLEGFLKFIISYRTIYGDINEEYEEVLKTMNTKFLISTKADMSLNDWMFYHGNWDKYYDILLSEANKLGDYLFRAKLKELDLVINPFFSKNIDNLDNNYAVYIDFYENKSINGSSFTLVDKETNVSFTTSKFEKGFELKMHVPSSENMDEHNIYHSFKDDIEMVKIEKIVDGKVTIDQYNLSDKDDKNNSVRYIFMQKLNNFIVLGSNINSKNIKNNSDNINDKHM